MPPPTAITRERVPALYNYLKQKYAELYHYVEHGKEVSVVQQIVDHLKESFTVHGRAEMEQYLAEHGLAGVQTLVIGEKGAKSLDAAEEATTRMDNLSIAREMEKAGKDALTIKIATGWERGADGKWRYETSDATDIEKIRKVLSPSIDSKYKACLLKDIVSNEFLSAYPLIDDVEVIMAPALHEDEYNGEFDNQRNRIIVRIPEVLDFKKLQSTLEHEIQHVVQDEEGFASGGDSNTAKDAYLKQKGIYEIYYELQNDEKGFNQTRNRILSENSEYTKIKDISIRLDDLFDAIPVNATLEEAERFIKLFLPDWKRGIDYAQLEQDKREEILNQHKV